MLVNNNTHFLFSYNIIKPMQKKIENIMMRKKHQEIKKTLKKKINVLFFALNVEFQTRAL